MSYDVVRAEFLPPFWWLRPLETIGLLVSAVADEREEVSVLKARLSAAEEAVRKLAAVRRKVPQKGTGR